MAILEAKIALESRLSSAHPSLQIAYPGVAFTPPDTVYLRCQTVIGKPDDPVRGATYRRENLSFQVFVLAPINKGESEGLIIAEQIAETFKRGTTLTVNSSLSVQIFESPHKAGSQIAENRLVFPVIVPVTVQVFI